MGSVRAGSPSAEPVSALAIRIQAQTVNLLMDLPDGLGLVFIAHKLAVACHISHDVMEMRVCQPVPEGRAALSCRTARVEGVWRQTGRVPFCRGVDGCERTGP
jgi:ABC-type glutathione transport system ATPase component